MKEIYDQCKNRIEELKTKLNCTQTMPNGDCIEQHSISEIESTVIIKEPNGNEYHFQKLGGLIKMTSYSVTNPIIDSKEKE